MRTENVKVDHGVDFPELLARVEYDRELLSEIFAIFLDNYPPLDLQLSDAVLRGDMKQVRATAHTLKGMLASLSFTRASASALHIEKLAAQEAPASIPEELARLKSLVAMASAHLGTFCQEVIR